MKNNKVDSQLLPPPGAKIVQMPSATTWLDETAGIVITLARGHQDLEQAQENMMALAKLTGGKRMPVIIDYTNIESLSREARLFYGNQDNANLVAACAVITGSLIGKLIANFHIGLNKANAPLRLFTDVAQAKEWLKQFMNND